MNKIPHIYIAGPYAAPTTHEIVRNINIAWLWGTRVAECGAYPVTPHANTALMHDIQTPGFWYRATIESMLRCDAVFLTPGWLRSPGSCNEADAAVDAGIPCMQNIVEVAEWVRKWYTDHGLPDFVIVSGVPDVSE